MRYFYIIVIAIISFFISCKKDQGHICKCEFPFLTGNQNTPFLAVNGESYWYNNDCWTYIGPTKDRQSTQPSIPGTNPNEWSRCKDLHKDCNSISTTTPTWTPRVYIKGEKVKLNNKIYIAFTQGNPVPEATNDDIWAKLCE